MFFSVIIFAWLIQVRIRSCYSVPLFSAETLKNGHPNYIDLYWIMQYLVPHRIRTALILSWLNNYADRCLCTFKQQITFVFLWMMLLQSSHNGTTLCTNGKRAIYIQDYKKRVKKKTKITPRSQDWIRNGEEWSELINLKIFD